MAHVWHPVITRDPRHSPPSGHPATLSKAEHPGRRGLTAARALPPLMQLPASLAEEVADPVTGGKLADLGQLTSGINPTQIILLLSPLLLYGTFYLYREKFDRKAKVRQGQQVVLLGPTTAHPGRCQRVCSSGPRHSPTPILPLRLSDQRLLVHHRGICHRLEHHQHPGAQGPTLLSSQPHWRQ